MANFESTLKTKVAAFIKSSKSHGDDAKEVFAMSAAFTIIHGRADYLTMLVNEVNAGDKAVLMTTLESINTHMLSELFKKNDKEKQEILSTLGDQNKLAMRVPVFAAEKEKGTNKIKSIQILSTPGAKRMRAALVGMFGGDEQQLADALAPISNIAIQKVSRAADDTFKEEEYLVNVANTIMKKLARTNPDEAKRVAKIIHSQLIPAGHEKKLSPGQIEDKIKEYASANQNELSNVDKKPGEGNDVKSEVSTDNLQEKRGNPNIAQQNRAPANRKKAA